VNLSYLHVGRAAAKIYGILTEKPLGFFSWISHCGLLGQPHPKLFIQSDPFDSCHPDERNLDLSSAGRAAPALDYSCGTMQQAHLLFSIKWCPGVSRGDTGTAANQTLLTGALFFQRVLWTLSTRVQTSKPQTCENDAEHYSIKLNISHSSVQKYLCCPLMQL